ncbi:MAG: hypothetical protein RLZZ123_2728, partial [Pseudomonadota bacterium]
IEALPIYHLVLRHAAWHLIDQGISPGARGSQSQMQIELHLIHQTREQTEVVLCSPWVDLACVVAPESITGRHG